MDRIKALLRSWYFDDHYKTKVHIGQISLVIVMFIFSGARIATKPSRIPVSRADTIGIVMGVKTIAILLYQILSSQVDIFRRWGSLKAYTILNSLEIVFWFVVLILTFMGISTFCEGTSCGLSWGIVLIATALIVLALWTAVVSYQTFRNAKIYAHHDQHAGSKPRASHLSNSLA